MTLPRRAAIQTKNPLVLGAHMIRPVFMMVIALLGADVLILK